MNKSVSFPLAKLLKEKGYDEQCENFYSKHGSLNDLKPHDKYEHLHSYTELLVSYFDGKYNWNSLDVDEGMIALKTAFSESDGYANCDCSAPNIVDVIMWLYEKHGIWVSVMLLSANGRFIWVTNKNDNRKDIKDIIDYNSPTEAYEAAIEYVLTNIL